MRLELELLQPAVRADAQRLDALLADEFLEVAATGRSFGKSEVMHRLPTEAGIAFAAEDMRVQMLAPEVALVTYVAQRTVGESTSVSKRCSLWVSTGSRWQLRYHQGTPSEALLQGRPAESPAYAV